MESLSCALVPSQVYLETSGARSKGTVVAEGYVDPLERLLRTVDEAARKTTSTPTPNERDNTCTPDPTNPPVQMKAYDVLLSAQDQDPETAAKRTILHILQDLRNTVRM